LERYFSRNGDVYLFFGKRGIIHKNKMVLNQTGVANNMSDRAILEKIYQYWLEFRSDTTTDHRFAFCNHMDELMYEYDRTRMATSQPIDDRFEKCIYAQKKCELNLTDGDGDPYCTVCLKCPKYRVIKEKKDGI
jgi:hypothetical protein